MAEQTPITVECRALSAVNSNGRLYKRGQKLQLPEDQAKLLEKAKCVEILTEAEADEMDEAAAKKAAADAKAKAEQEAAATAAAEAAAKAEAEKAAAEAAKAAILDGTADTQQVETPVQELQAIGALEEQAEALVAAGFDSIAKIQAATKADLVKVATIGEATAKKLKAAADAVEVVEGD